jgi:hypothetical protein
MACLGNLHRRTGTTVDRRIEELNNLRIALATFAIHLDAFEARLTGRPTKSLAEPMKAASQDLAFAKQIVAAMSGQSVQSR